jgi:hypothetical protein
MYATSISPRRFGVAMANEPPDRAADRILAELGGRPRLRDRNWFFHQLLNSDLNDLERIRPLWRQYRRHLRNARKRGREVRPAVPVRPRVVDERQYRELETKAGHEKTAKRAAKRLLTSIRRARRRLKRVTTGDVSRSTMKRDARVVARKLRRVRQRADELTAILSRRSRDAIELARLDVTFHHRNAPEDRRKRYADLKTVLDALERQVTPIMRDIGERQRTLKAKLRQHQRDSENRDKR